MERRNTEPEPMDTEESDLVASIDNAVTDSITEQPEGQSNYLDANENEVRNKKKVIERNKEKLKANTMTSGTLFIDAFMDLLRDTNARTEVIFHYMERVLHSIFFFGHIHYPPITPDEFIPRERTKGYKEIFPKPFAQYNTHLPYYTPYSILLEYMTNRKEWENLDSLWKKLENVNKSLLKPHNEREDQFIANDFAFKASVVSFCFVKDSNDAKVLRKAFGSSMSCKGKIERKIMIAISALHVWDRAVSYAVYSADKGLPITFPERVKCTAYRFKDKKYIPPCNKCFTMFDVDFIPEHEAHNKEEHWLFGNCAETESLSRLLQCDEEVRKEICIIDNGKKLMNREEIENKFKEEYEDAMKKRARNYLSSRKFKLPRGEWNFFTPDQLG